MDEQPISQESVTSELPVVAPRRKWGLWIGIAIFLVVAIVAILSGHTFLHSSPPTDPTLIPRLTTLTEEYLAHPDDASSTAIRIERLGLMNAHRGEIEHYLSASFSTESADPKYQDIFRDYLLIALGNMFSGASPSEDIMSALADTASSSAANGLTSDEIQYQQNMLLSTVSDFSISPGENSAIAIITDFQDSGAYNLFEKVVRVGIASTGLTLATLPVIDEIHGEPVIRSDSTDVTGFPLVNITYYDASTSEVAEYGMRPFGLYPCNPTRYYRVLPDRLIYLRTETPDVCIGKDIQDPSDLDKYFTSDTDFSKKTVTDTASAHFSAAAKALTLPPTQ